jgi:hypothetical protein
MVLKVLHSGAGGRVMTRRKWLHRAGLIVGLAGLVVLIVWGLFNAEGGPKYAIPGLMIYVTPSLIGILIVWKWPLAGGITLVAIALGWLVFVNVLVFSVTTPHLPLSDMLHLSVLIAPVTLPPLVSGILFLLYWRAEWACLARKKGLARPV